MSDTTTARPDLTGKAQEVMRDAKAKASELGGDAARMAKENAARLGESAREFADQAKDKVESAVSERKSLSADYIRSIAQATAQAAAAFDSELPQAARYIRQASDQMQGMADTVRERDVRELVADVQDFARRQPTLFFGGAVLLGFAALRFLKSTPPGETAFDARRQGPSEASSQASSQTSSEGGHGQAFEDRQRQASFAAGSDGSLDAPRGG